MIIGTMMNKRQRKDCGFKTLEAGFIICVEMERDQKNPAVSYRRAHLEGILDAMLNVVEVAQPQTQHQPGIIQSWRQDIIFLICETILFVLNRKVSVVG